jgi:uncharacterized protein (DUF2147 family)
LPFNRAGMTQLVSRSRFNAAAVAGLAAMALAPAVMAQSPDVTGVWIDHTGRGAVEISRCGNAICGRIAWLQQPNDPAGKPLTDGNNPNSALRSRPICGLQVIGDVKPKGEGAYADGWIYNPEDGGRFSLDVKLLGPDRLQIHGFMGMRFLGEKHEWQRAPSTQARCK